MAEIMLGLGRGHLGTLNKMAEVIPDLHGVKILRDEAYRLEFQSAYQQKRNHNPSHIPVLNFASACRYARQQKARTIMLDTAFGFDKPKEMSEAVQRVIGEATVKSSNELMHRISSMPTSLTVTIDLPRSAIYAFYETAHNNGLDAVCHLTSSRFSKEDYEDIGTTAWKNALWRAKLAKKRAPEINTFICAAADAEPVREILPDVYLYATGGYVQDESDKFSHENASLIDNTRSYVDCFIVGSPIMEDPNPAQTACRYIMAARGEKSNVL